MQCVCVSGVQAPALRLVLTSRRPPEPLFTFPVTRSLEERKHSDAGLLMLMFSTCQSGGELSGSGSVNWALIRCCSN